MTEYDKRNLRFQEDQSKRLNDMSNAIRSQGRILEEIRDEIRSQTRMFSEDLTGLRNTMNSVGRNVRTLTDVTVSIEEAKAVAARDTRRKLLEKARNIWSRARDRFANQYKRIITDYVRGLVENVERFCRLVADELAPLFRIKNSTLDFQSIVQDMEPRIADELRVEAALAMSGSRATTLEEEYGSARHNLASFVDERKSLVDRIEATRISRAIPWMEDVAPGEIVLFSIPMYLAKLEGPNGEERVVRITPSRTVTNPENSSLPESLDLMCPAFHSATESAPRFGEGQLSRDAERTDFVLSRPAEALEHSLSHMEEVGASSLFRGAVRKFYAENYDDWTPDDRLMEESVSE